MKSLLPLVILLTGCTHSFHLPPATGPAPPTKITVTNQGPPVTVGPALLVTDRTQEPVIVSAATVISGGHQTLTIQSLTDSPAPQKAADDWPVIIGVTPICEPNTPCKITSRAADAAPEAIDVPPIQEEYGNPGHQWCDMGQCVWQDGTSPFDPPDAKLARRTRLTCADKTRFLMTSEEGSKHCIKLKAK